MSKLTSKISATIQDGPAARWTATYEDGLVDVYDATQEQPWFGQYGQFVCTYAASALIRDRREGRTTCPLRMDLGVPAWTMSAEARKALCDFAEAASVESLRDSGGAR